MGTEEDELNIYVGFGPTDRILREHPATLSQCVSQTLKNDIW